MKLFVIGNGFDIGHGLSTRYWDFRTFLESVDWDFLHAFEEHYAVYPQSSDGAKKKILWNEFEKNLANIDEDVIVEQAENIEMGLESGDVGIEDTLYEFFSNEYRYIAKLSKYLKRWARTIRIMDIKPKTTLVDENLDDMYVTFNYTSVLENAYGIKPMNIIHIHGSLRKDDDDPILGHGNEQRIDDMRKNLEKAKDLLDEKRSSICRVIDKYYAETFKDVGRYMHKLSPMEGKQIDEIHVIGHSIAGVDLLYFKTIDRITEKGSLWVVYCFSDDEISGKRAVLRECGIDDARIITLSTAVFYNL